MSKNNYKRLFANNYEYKPDQTINQAIFTRIEHYVKIRRRISYTLHAFITIISGISFIMASIYIFNSARDAGLFEYISIFFSDWSTAMMHWKEISMSIIDSLPFTELAILLTITLILINSIIRINFNKQNIINLYKQTI